MSEAEFDTELIECFICKKVLNGKNLWVVSDFNDEVVTVCEDCKANNNHLRKNYGKELMGLK